MVLAARPRAKQLLPYRLSVYSRWRRVRCVDLALAGKVGGLSFIRKQPTCAGRGP